MKTFEVEITGTTPLLLNKFTDAAQQAATSGTRSAITGSKGLPREQAETKLYYGLDGKTLVVPQPNLFRCLIDAGKFFKAGKSKVTTQKTSLIPACVEVDGVTIPLLVDGWEVDTRPVRIPATGGRILCHRPRFDKWMLRFTIHIDTEMMDEKLLREIVDCAGKRIGLGDFRPDNKGPFGKFCMTS